MRLSTTNFRSFITGVLIAVVATALSSSAFAGGKLLPTDETQTDFLKAYKAVMYHSYADYRFESSNADSLLFPLFGEESVYWAITGDERGSFVVPNAVHSSFSSAVQNDYETYDWSAERHYSIQYKPSSLRVAIFKSQIEQNGKSVTWQSVYFKNLFDTYLYGNIYYFVDENYLDTNNISSATQVVIIPSFAMNGEDEKYFIDSSFALVDDMRDKFEAFLARGGTLIAEGNAVYFVEKLGLLSQGAVNFDNAVPADSTNLLDIDFEDTDNPIGFTEDAVGDYLYATSVPQVDLPASAEVIAVTDLGGTPVSFVLKGDDAFDGRVVCNTGLPTVGGFNEIENEDPEYSRQLQWTLNAFMYAFCSEIDVTRSVYNDLPDSVTAGKNAVSYDREDYFEIRVLARNLSDRAIGGVNITESMRRVNLDGTWTPYFEIVEVSTPGVEHELGSYYVKLKDLTIPARSERTIVYRMKTPEPEDPIHEEVDKFISWRNYIYATYNTTYVNDREGYHKFNKYRNYVDLMFGARLEADTDLNWKNFLGLYYQPFKVFMIMENKERTNAENTVYTQYIPKDVPFYWSDKSINIPILKTPGGKFVDVLRGSNDENNPDFDMDSDDKPDVWLDTASIYPKGYTIEEDEVYWLNPWEHLRTGDNYYYEDIDHDGQRAQDLDGDGIVDIEEPGDKIRVWKVTWDIGKVPGYGFFDPYCSYEIWVDPPDLLKLSCGTGFAYGMNPTPVDGMFYPYTEDIGSADLTDTTWSHWMERDDEGEVIWKQLIRQRIGNYEGFAFVDTSTYRLKPTDELVGTVPQPHREFIAVLSLGGEEIDMYNPTPQQSLYSNLDYKTIFNENRTTPIRSTYTYYAPLPNPLQFEYLSNNFTIFNEDGEVMQFLPEWGDAVLEFDIDASTEYTYYWIRNVGHDIDYGDPSEQIEGVEELGDGVFGYMIYEIPKGMGGYSIDLPRKSDGSFDLDAIVQVDGNSFKKLLDNPNTGNEIEIWENPFSYEIYIPQLLIPPALDDDNFDGIDDWIDDRGDRFCSSTGFLHDAFMLDDGEDWLDYPEERFRDDIYGWVDSGWYHGADETYGDDFFENLGKTHFKIRANYTGYGKEGSIDISKGGWLVVEEIFGGSPWVIFSHTLQGYAEGVDFKIASSSNPSKVKYGIDTGYVKHVIYDANEPHFFNSDFDPWRVSYGYGEAAFTTYVGGRDPCSLIRPNLPGTNILDPEVHTQSLTLIPDADPENPELDDYPKEVEGVFVQVLIEAMNGTDDNWINTTVTPHLPPSLGESEIVMSYVAYPRPLVPAKVDPQTGEVIQGGDDIGAFKAGWRFNEPEGEVLIKVGNTLPLLQPSRRAYFVFLLKVDETPDNGTYQFTFSTSGRRVHYDGLEIGEIDYQVPPALFCIGERDANGNVVDYEPIVLGTGSLEDVRLFSTDAYRGLENARWSLDDVNHSDFLDLTDELESSYDENTGIETLNLQQFDEFPTIDNYAFYILQEGEIYSYDDGDEVIIADSASLGFSLDARNSNAVSKLKESPRASTRYDIVQDDPIEVVSSGPKINVYKEVWSVNGIRVESDEEFTLTPGDRDVETMIEAYNRGNDMNENTVLEIYPGEYFQAREASLPENCSLVGDVVEARLGSFVPGESKRIFLHFEPTVDACAVMYDKTELIPYIEVSYRGAADKELFMYPEKTILDFPALDLKMFGLNSMTAEVAFGNLVQLKAEIVNGVVEADSVDIAFYSVINKIDTVEIGTRRIETITENTKTDIEIDFEIPEDTKHLQVLAVIDPDDERCEFCENNNSKIMTIPILGPYWAQDVGVYPNPVKTTAEIRYSLARDMRSVSLAVYDAEGRIVGEQSGLPATNGVNSAFWDAGGAAKGAYFYQLIGVNENGETEKYYGTMIKD